MLYSVLLASTLPQHKSAVDIPMSPLFRTFPPPPTPSHPCRLLQSPSLSSLSHTANFDRHYFHTVASMSPCYSPHLFHLLLPSLRPQVVLCLYLHRCPAKRFISTIVLDSIYTRFVLLFLTSLCIIGSGFIYLIRMDSNAFTFMAE